MPSLKLQGQLQPRKNDIKHEDQEVLERLMFAQNALSNLSMTSAKLQGQLRQCKNDLSIVFILE
jgi:hypothetical protein